MSISIITTCPQCGAEIAANTIACEYCGYRVPFLETSKTSNKYISIRNGVYAYIEPIIDEYIIELKGFLNKNHQDRELKLEFKYVEKKETPSSTNPLLGFSSPAIKCMPNDNGDYGFKLVWPNKKAIYTHRIKEFGGDVLFDTCSENEGEAWVSVMSGDGINPNLKQALMVYLSVGFASSILHKDTPIDYNNLKYEISSYIQEKYIEDDSASDVFFCIIGLFVLIIIIVIASSL